MLDAQVELQCANMQDYNWHLNFKVPDKDTLGPTVAEAIDTGVVTSVARRQLVEG